MFVCTMKNTSVNYRMVLTLIPCFSPCAITKFREDIYAYLCFRPFQSSSPMITSQPTCMVKRRGVYSYNTHGTILKSSSRGRRTGGQSSTGTGLKLQGPSISLKAQYLPTASAVFQMTFICLSTIFDANFQMFQMLHVKLGGVV